MGCLWDCDRAFVLLCLLRVTTLFFFFFLLLREAEGFIAFLKKERWSNSYFTSLSLQEDVKPSLDEDWQDPLRTQVEVAFDLFIYLLI